jgi:hypothetical protein
MNPGVLEGDREEVHKAVKGCNSRWRSLGTGLRVRDLREASPAGHFLNPLKREE